MCENLTTVHKSRCRALVFPLADIFFPKKTNYSLGTLLANGNFTFLQGMKEEKRFLWACSTGTSFIFLLCHELCMQARFIVILLQNADLSAY